MADPTITALHLLDSGVLEATLSDNTKFPIALHSWVDASGNIASLASATISSYSIFARVRGQVNGSNGLTRPSDTNAYTAKDAISDSTSAPHVWQFTNMARSTGGSGSIVKAILLTDQTTNTESFRLHLYNAAPTAINDNAADTSPLFVDVVSYIGKINFPACQVEGTGATAAYAVNDYDVISFICNADANLYGILETPNGFTPATGEKFEIVLMVSQN